MHRSWLRRYGEVARSIQLEITHSQIVNKSFLRKMFLIFALVIILFLLEDFLKYPPAIPAIIGAGLAVTLSRRYVRIEELLHFVDWTTLVFFISMFMVVRGVERLGTIDFIASSISAASAGPTEALMLVLWISAVMSAF